MVCTNCGERPVAWDYKLLFNPDGRGPKEIDLPLCAECLDELENEPSIERSTTESMGGPG